MSNSSTKGMDGTILFLATCLKIVSTKYVFVQWNKHTRMYIYLNI